LIGVAAGFDERAMMKSVIVTGGSGKAGRAVIGEWLDHGSYAPQHTWRT
jgi:hypothetical protein